MAAASDRGMPVRSAGPSRHGFWSRPGAGGRGGCGVPCLVASFPCFTVTQATHPLATAGRKTHLDVDQMGPTIGMNALKKISRRRFLKSVGLSGASTLPLRSGCALAVEPMWRLDVTRYAVSPPRWPKGFKLSLAVIADLHAGGPAMPL